jgi:putative DNA primase/helicase
MTDEHVAEPAIPVNGVGVAPHRYDREASEGKGTPYSALPAHSELALTERFVDRHEDELRYVGAWRSWLTFDGERWQVEKTHLPLEFAKRIAREAALETSGKAARDLASKHTASAIVDLARADRKIAAIAEQWDVDPWLLNTPGGTMDLRTGQMRAPWEKDYITRVTATEPDAMCPYPLWCLFLSRIFNGDVALIAYVQRVLGYALTGSTKEQALFFGYGTGANGKSVLLDTITGIMGDYAKSAPIETFTVSTGERHPTELAGLRGARLVTAVETEEGRRWAESRIKALTGGDTISARFMRQDFFEFRPQFKLVIAGNHKPGLRSVDEAIRRRFNLLPFAVTIPPSERDPDLTKRLKTEWPGILSWMIQGCLLWQERGLQPPPAVADATAAYLEAEDALGAWMQACCTRTVSATGKALALYTSWKAYAERAGEPPGSQKGFAHALEARGFEGRRTKRGIEYVGIELVEEEALPPHWSDR